MMLDPFSPERFLLFFAKVEPAPAPKHLIHLGDCWMWTGAINDRGYGVFYCPGFPAIGGGRRRNARAHRWSMAFWYGAAKLDGLTHDHLCRRTACVNPRHGAAISLTENTARGNRMRYEPVLSDPFEDLAL